MESPAWPGSWINIKVPSYQYRKCHRGDKTVVRSSYLQNGISYTGKMTSLYWIRAQATKSQHISPWTKWLPFCRQHFLCNFMNERFGIFIHISLTFVPKNLVYNRSALVQVMAWHWTGDKPISEPMLTQFTDAYAALGWEELNMSSLR